MKKALIVYVAGLLASLLAVWFLSSPGGTIASGVCAVITAGCMLYVLKVIP